uniref:Uncharacterized protein n=1 Tax=Micrurus corallinus TaxID=54390 RepID=A0A2D4G2Y2_MICCO
MLVSRSTYLILTNNKKEGQVGTLHLRVFIFIMILVFHSPISFNIKWSKRKKSALVLTSIIQSSQNKNVQDGLVKKWQKCIQFRISTLGVPPGERKKNLTSRCIVNLQYN